MKHVTYYLLMSISFPYIHTRQVGHDEGPQLLLVGELEQETRTSGGRGRRSLIHQGCAAASEPHQCSTQLLWNLLGLFVSDTSPLPVPELRT